MTAMVFLCGNSTRGVDEKTTDEANARGKQVGLQNRFPLKEEEREEVGRLKRLDGFD